MQLIPGTHAAIAHMRQEKLVSYQVPLLPDFHQHLAQHADVLQIWEQSSAVGYALLLHDRREAHEHVTLLELYLSPPYVDRYEDAIDLIREAAEPRVYLVRSDECVVETALLAHGYPMEVSMSVMAARAVPDPGPSDGLLLQPLDLAHLRAGHDLYLHARGAEQTPSLEDLERAMGKGAFWLLTANAEPVGLVARQESAGTRYGLLDIMAPHVGDREQVWALLTAGKMLEREGLMPAAVIDSRDSQKLGVFRAADFYTAATYLVFYDPLAGRPSVGVVDREQLRRMIQAKEDFHLIDVMGEQHWRAGHLPGAEWLEFRNLSREARRRYGKDDALVVYCNDYT